VILVVCEVQTVGVAMTMGGSQHVARQRAPATFLPINKRRVHSGA